jgi:hypothetical protein
MRDTRDNRAVLFPQQEYRNRSRADNHGHHCHDQQQHPLETHHGARLAGRARGEGHSGRRWCRRLLRLQFLGLL